MATPSKQRKNAKTKAGSSPISPRRKQIIVTKSDGAAISVETDVGNVIVDEDEESRDSLLPKPSEKTFIFKQPNFVHSSIGSAGNKKTRVWKNLKQIVAAEKALPWGPDDTTYGMIDAPPSFKPAMKYSDISGLVARYTDPQTKLRYANTDEFSRIKMMPSDLVTGCLTLRKANVLV